MAGGGAPESVQGEGLQPYGALDCFEWRSEGGAGGRAESPQCARRRIPPALHAEYGPKGVQGGERKATLLAATGDNFAARIPPGGA